MKNNQFPNGLRIVRRNVNKDEAIDIIDNLLKRIDSYKNQKNEFLAKYLKDAKRINLE